MELKKLHMGNCSFWIRLNGRSGLSVVLDFQRARRYWKEADLDADGDRPVEKGYVIESQGCGHRFGDLPQCMPNTPQSSTSWQC